MTAAAALRPGHPGAANAPNSIALALLSSLREPLAFVVRQGGQVLLTGGNPALERLLGRTAAELPSFPLSRVLPEDWRPVEQAMARNAPVRFQARAVDRFGAACTVVVRVEPVGVANAGAAAHALLYLDPDGAELEVLRALTARLQASEDGLKRQAAHLGQMQQELDAFSTMLSHDLRAPLRTIDGFAQILAEDHADQMDRFARDHLQRIRTASSRMNRMIDALRELSSLAARNCTPVPVDFSALAEDVASELRQERPSGEVVIVIEPDMQVRGDAAMLRVLLQNLIGNAMKFTARRPVARIDIGTVVDGAGRRSYVVRDNGEGFDMRFSERLFGLFQRLHSADAFPGTGVGLATARRIVRRHGGEIWARGKPGEGASFGFTLPD